MTVSDTIKRKILVVAVNARPIVESVLASGQTLAGCVDYFGDWDLISMMPDVAPLYTVIRQEKEKINKRNLFRSLSETLFLLTEELSSAVDFDYIIIGGGVHGEFFTKLSKLGHLLGSNQEAIEIVRDRNKLYDFCKNNSNIIKIPNLEIINDENSLYKEIHAETSTPRIIKPCASDGGINTFLLEEKLPTDEKKRILNILTPYLPCYVIEFISGEVFSAKVLSAGNKATVLSFNLQLSGLGIVNSPERFTYSGNIVPLITDKKTLDRIYSIKEEIEEITLGLNLSGSVGFDFVIKKNTDIYLLESNPRIQGTLEPFELASGQNMIDALISARENQKLINWSPQDFKYSAAKIVLYTPERMVVPQLMENSIKDVPLRGSIVEKGQPYCSLISRMPLTDSSNILGSLNNQVEEIYNFGKLITNGVGRT